MDILLYSCNIQQDIFFTTATSIIDILYKCNIHQKLMFHNYNIHQGHNSYAEQLQHSSCTHGLHRSQHEESTVTERAVGADTAHTTNNVHVSKVIFARSGRNVHGSLIQLAQLD
ncbi:hypothetical protein BsWGS_20553 [Bradybaena similaris]